MLPNQNTELQAFEFNGDQIVTCMVDGQPHVAMRHVVENLGLDWTTQVKKINAQQQKYSCGHMPMTGADGKRYNMLVMPTNRVTLWLASINPLRIKDKTKRLKIELYQAECAEALYNYWHQGVAVRGDMDGVVTELDPKIMQAIGGMMKGIVNKALSEIVPALVQQQIANKEFGIVHGVTAHDAANMAGITDRKGLRGLGNFISSRLRRYHAEKGVAVKLRDYGAMASVLVFDKLTVREWLAEGGKASIREYIDNRRGQSKLKLVA